MIRSLSLFSVIASLLLCLLVCSGCDQKTGETAAGRATPPPDSPAGKFLKNSAAGRPGSRQPGGFQK